MTGNELIFVGNIQRSESSKNTWQIKLVNHTKCIARIEGVNLSAIIFGLQVDEVKVGQTESCQIGLADGSQIKDKIGIGTQFELITGSEEVIGSGQVTELKFNF